MRTRIFILMFLIALSGIDWRPSGARADHSRGPGTCESESALCSSGSAAANQVGAVGRRQWQHDSTAAGLESISRATASRRDATAPPPAHVNVAPMTAQAMPVLPAVFHGCWQGQVNELDWIRREPGAHKIGFWTPKTYRLCYKQVGDQPFKLTFTETGVEPNDKIINARGEVVPLATDGRAYATMRSRLSFDEYRTHFDGSSPTFAVDEGTNLDCRIAGDEMLVGAGVYGTRDGTPWFRAHWRADFHKFDN